MIQTLFVVFVVVLFFGLVACQSDSSSSSIESTYPHVRHLTSDTFNQLVLESHDDTLFFVKFFAPWCPHCKHLLPTWDSLAQHYENSRVQIASVDCTQHSSICTAYSIQGYPTLLAIWGGEVVAEYLHGPRSFNALKEFADNLSMETPFDGIVVQLDDRMYEQHTNRLGTRWIVFVQSSNHQDEDQIKVESSTIQDQNQIKVASSTIQDQNQIKVPSSLVKALADHFKHSHVHVAYLDCSQHEKLCEKFKSTQVTFAPVFKLEAGSYIPFNTGENSPLDMNNLLNFAERSVFDEKDRPRGFEKVPRPGLEDVNGGSSGSFKALIISITVGVIVIGIFFIGVIFCLLYEEEEEEKARERGDGVIYSKMLDGELPPHDKKKVK